MLKSLMLGSTAAMIVRAAETGNGNGGKNAQRQAKKSVFTADDGSDVSALDDGDIAEAYRNAVNDTLDDETSLSDDQILLIIRAIPGDETNEVKGKEVREKRLSALRTASEKEALEDMTEAPLVETSQAKAMGEIADKVSLETDTFIDSSVNWLEQWNGAPVTLALMLCKDLGGTFEPDGYPLACPAVRQIPVPFSRTTELPKGSNIEVDRYPFIDDNGNSKNGNAIRDFGDRLPYGKELLQRIADLRLLVSQKNVDVAAIKTQEYRSAEYIGNTGGIAEAEQARMVKRRNSRTTALAKAIGFLQVVTRFASGEFDKVSWRFVVPDAINNMKQVVTMSKPVRLRVVNDKDGSPSRPWSLTQFNNLQRPNYAGEIRFNVALKNGGRMVDFLKAFNRPPKKDGDKAGAQTGGGDDKLGGYSGMPSPEQVESFSLGLLNLVDAKAIGREAADLNRSKIIRHFTAAKLETKEAFVEAASTMWDIAKIFTAEISAHAEAQQKANTDAAKAELRKAG